MKITTTIRQLLTQCKIHGSGDAQIILSMELIIHNTPSDLFLKWTDNCVTIRAEQSSYEIHRL